MKNTAIIYGSTSGNCENIANKIAAALGINDVISASALDDAFLDAHEAFLLGSSTWGAGDLQDDWYGAVDTIRAHNLGGKTVAVFGCGDSYGFADTFCAAMAQLADAAADAGATIVGAVYTDGYNATDSDAVRNGSFVGLALDEDNESDLTDSRIEAWVEKIKPSLA